MEELKTQRRSITLGLLCVGVTSILTPATIPLVKEAAELIEAASAKQPVTFEILKICILIVGVYGVKYWFTRGQSFYLSRAVNRLAAQLRLKMFVKLQRLPTTYFNQTRSGSVQSVLTNDVTVYQSAVSIIRDSIDAPVKAMGALAYIVWQQWQLAVATVVFLPIMAIAIQRNARKMKRAQTAVQEDLATLNAMTLEALQGNRIVKAFAAEDRIASEYQGLIDQTLSSQMQAVKIQAALRPLVEFLGATALATVFYISGLLAYHGSLKISDLLALAMALDLINQGFRQIGNVNNTYAQVQAAAERIHTHVLDVPEEHVESNGATTLPDLRGDIEFRNVSFAYPDGTQALRNVSFQLPAGSSLALVGPSGAGKSTIADLVLRFYEPTEGQILIDGVDIRELEVAWLRGQIGVVPQHTFLFAGTLSENVRMGNPEASQEEIEHAAKAAHMDAFAEAYPERYELRIGEQGSGLSGGQKQRVAIARALVRHPKILLLDEATSALDPASEKVVTEALAEVMSTRTTLFIAHRLTTAARADKILVLSRGEVVEQGSHRELIEANGAYAGLFRAFSGGVLD